LRDLTYFDEDNDPAEQGKINFKQRKKLFGVMTKIRHSQHIPYPFEPLPKVREFLNYLVVLNAEKQYQLSLEIEPRESRTKK
jgi:hypothetical protein